MNDDRSQKIRFQVSVIWIMDSCSCLKMQLRVVFPSRMLPLFMMFLVMCIPFSFLTLYTLRYFWIHQSRTIIPNIIDPCYVEISNNLEKWIKPPSDLMHTMNDSELFWRATMVPGINKYPFHRVPKIAFMFLTRGGLPLSPLWERFLKGHDGSYSVYVHSTPASFRARFRPSSVFYKRQIPSQVVEWGEMSICDAERRLLANALLDVSNEWFVLLSESCIPLYNFTTVFNYISNSHLSFLEAFDDPGPVGRGRYNDSMAPEVTLTQWRKGSQWFELNRHLAVALVQDQKYYPKFEEFCRPDCYVDEHYFSTMLTIEKGSMLANRSLTWVDWSRGGSHPASFGEEDVTVDFVERIVQGGRRNCSSYDGGGNSSSVCFLFARKFTPSALEPLLSLPRYVLGY